MVCCVELKTNLTKMKTQKDIEQAWNDIKKYEQKLKNKTEELEILINKLSQKQCAINGVSNNEACVVSVCEDCKIPFTYDWHLEYNTCPKCGKDEAN